MTRFLIRGLTIVGLLASAAGADIDYWRFKNIVGFVRAIAVDPTNENRVYIAVSNAATYYGEHGTPFGLGVYLSTDAGTNFSPLNNGLTDPDVSSLAIDPTSPNVIYAATVGGGVFKSTNSGGNWSATNTGLGSLDVYTVAVDPVSPNNVYAGLDGGGIYRSIDGGATWLATGGAPGVIWQIAIDPTTPSTLYAATVNGVRKSVNSGANWSSTGVLTVVEDGEPRNVFDVRAVLIDVSNPSTVFAGAHDAGGVFKSTNGGTTWVHSSGLRSAFNNYRFMTAMAQDPVNPSTLYASSTRDTYRSLDGGATWVVFNTGLSRGEAYGLATTSTGGAFISDVFGDFHQLASKPSVVDHMRCFKARGTGGTGFTEQLLTVDDRFGTDSIVVFKPYRFCTPTSASGDPITDATTHLVCYKIRGSRFPSQWIPFLSQRLDGYRAYEVNRRDTLCVPAEVDGVPSAETHDSYRCMGGRHWSSDDLDMTLTDAFGSQTLRVTKNDRVCGPTDILGEGRQEPGVDLRCDKIYGNRNQPTPKDITVTDRFGTRTLRINKTDSHCVPALEDRN